jgi:acyl-CoA synthetase (NDP forming)
MELAMAPRSVAIIGASSRPHTVGNTIIKNLINLGYKGKIYPVNPKYQVVEGLKCFPSVLDINDNIDVVVIAVQAKTVPHVLVEAGKKNIRYAIIITSGFSEIGGMGEELQRKILEISNQYNIRLIGPNTTGILNLESRFTSTFVILSPELKPGNVSFVAQTGVFSASMLRWIFTGEAFRLNKVIGLGNKVDVDDVDALRYLYNDKSTKVILIYMEGLKRAREFFSQASLISREKPIIIVKSGRSRSGAKASLSHTGSLSIPDDIFEGMCRQAGIIRALDFEEAFDYVKILSFYGRFEGGGIAVASYSGAECVMAADALEECSLELCNLSEETMSKIASYAPPFWPKSHPIDLGPILESDNPAEGLVGTFNALTEDPRVETLIIVLPIMSKEEGGMLEVGAIDGEILRGQMLQLLKRHPKKKIILVLDGSKMGIDEGKQLLEEIGIPTYTTVRRAAKALSVALWWSRKSKENQNI